MMVTIVISAAVLNFFGSSYYIWNTLIGVTKPNRVTFLLWAVAPLIGAAAAFSSGVTWATLSVFVSGMMPLLIFLSSFVNPNSYWELRPFDYWCGALSALALILWLITKQPVLAIIFAIASDFLAGVPTAIKAWRHPETETATGYATAAISNASSFLVMKQFTFVNYAFPAYLVVFCVYLTFAIVRKRIGFE